MVSVGELILGRCDRNGGTEHAENGRYIIDEKMKTSHKKNFLLSSYLQGVNAGYVCTYSKSHGINRSAVPAIRYLEGGEEIRTLIGQ